VSSTELYESIRERDLACLRSGAVELDRVLAAGLPDSRRGISLVMPASRIAPGYEGLVARFAAVDPAQYYYPRSDLHITIFDFTQAREGCVADPGLEASFREISRAALASFAGFAVELRGVVFNRAAGIVKGFDRDRLLGLRQRIRKELVARGIRNDERYESGSAHITFARFRQPPADPAALCEAAEAAREIELGHVDAGEVELVEHDWYNSPASRRLLERFRL
jgi:2'-5' RNA ligase